jgi:TnpA family transposase
LAVALRELGRIERTLFILDWLQSVELCSGQVKRDT